MSDYDPEAPNRALKRLMDEGADMAGTTFGAVAGSLLIGPVGAAVGAAAGVTVTHCLRRLGQEVGQRYLSPREAKRVGAALILARQKIEEKINSGLLPCSDGFFNQEPGRRSSAE